MVTFESSFADNVAPSKRGMEDGCNKTKGKKSETKSVRMSIEGKTKDNKKSGKRGNKRPWAWINDVIRVKRRNLHRRS